MADNDHCPPSTRSQAASHGGRALRSRTGGSERADAHSKAAHKKVVPAKLAHSKSNTHKMNQLTILAHAKKALSTSAHSASAHLTSAHSTSAHSTSAHSDKSNLDISLKCKFKFFLNFYLVGMLITFYFFLFSPSQSQVSYTGAPSHCCFGVP